VWLGAAIGIGIGALVLIKVLAGWRRVPAPAPPSATPDAEVAEEFGRFRNEFGR
jgi:hypothetical protein